ncbi:PREDICTED: spindle pole body component 110-like [Nicotiana attenuata]|uniref:spindle pole body component 110-like n=1 Tax=Nicotiana attenuata TaxID=49451 RepID=UPI000904C542|nr:PREDICTED: spindle pole body component 110-like [Nicotiana attenuata]
MVAWMPHEVADLEDWVRKLDATSSYDERRWRDLVKGRWEAKLHGIGDVSEMMPAPPREETESPIPKSGKDNKRKRVSKPEDPQDGRGPTRRRRRNLIHVDIDSVHQLNDEEEDEGEESALVSQTRKPAEASKPPNRRPCLMVRRLRRKTRAKPLNHPRVDDVADLNDAATLFEEAQRLFSQAFTRFRADLSQCEAELQKTSDEGKALKLLCSQMEEELKDLRADQDKARKNEAELDKQPKLDRIELLRGEVDPVKADSNRLKENMDRLAGEKEAALAKLASAVTQLRGAKEKSLARAKRIDELEAKLAEAEVKLAEARAEVENTKVTADKTVAVYLRDAEAAQEELREASDREKRSNDLARCQSRRQRGPKRKLLPMEKPAPAIDRIFLPLFVLLFL